MEGWGGGLPYMEGRGRLSEILKMIPKREGYEKGNEILFLVVIRIAISDPTK